MIYVPHHLEKSIQPQ